MNGTFLVNFVHIYQYVTGRTKSQFIFNLAESSSTGITIFLIVSYYLANLKRFLKPIKIAELIIYTELLYVSYLLHIYLETVRIIKVLGYLSQSVRRMPILFSSLTRLEV